MKKIIVWVLFILFGMVLVRTAWIGDDALITIRTVLNYIHGNGLVFNVGERVQAYTHTLWFFILSLSYWIVGNIYYSTFIISILTTLLAMFVLIRYIAIDFINIFLVLIFAILSTAFIDYGTSGLENPMSYLLIAWIVYRFIDEYQNNFSGKLYKFWFIFALIFLNRPDLVLIVLPLILYVTYQKYTKQYNLKYIIRDILIGLTPMIVWTLFSLFYYGFPLPNTAYAKLTTGIPQVELIAQGVLYYLETIKHDPFTLIFISFGIYISFYSKDRLKVLLSLGIFLYSLYILKIGGDFMTGRFFAVAFFVSLLILATFKIKLENSYYIVFIILVGIGIVSISQTGGILRKITYNSIEKKATQKTGSSGITDERLYYYLSKHSLIDSGRYTFDYSFNYDEPIMEKYNKIIDSCGGLGLLALESGPNSYYIDTCGLANSLLSKIPMAYDSTEWRVGHFRRSIPIGYNRALTEDITQLNDKTITKYYQKIALITRGDLWSYERIKTIIKINLGYYNHWLDKYSSIDAQYLRKIGRLHKIDIPYSQFQNRKIKIMGVKSNIDITPIKNGDYISITLDTPKVINSFDISYEWNDEYMVQFLYKGKVVKYKRLQGSYVKGLYRKFVSLDEDITIDKITIIPQRGDTRYTIGHFRVYSKE